MTLLRRTVTLLWRIVTLLRRTLLLVQRTVPLLRRTVTLLRRTCSEETVTRLFGGLGDDLLPVAAVGVGRHGSGRRFGRECNDW